MSIFHIPSLQDLRSEFRLAADAIRRLRGAVRQREDARFALGRGPGASATGEDGENWTETMRNMEKSMKNHEENHD